MENKKAGKIHLTLTQDEADAMFTAGLFAIRRKDSKANTHLVYAMQKLDEAVNG